MFCCFGKMSGLIYDYLLRNNKIPCIIETGHKELKLSGENMIQLDCTVILH